MKFNFKQNLLLIASIFGIAATANKITITNKNNPSINNNIDNNLIKRKNFTKNIIASPQGDVNLNTKKSNTWLNHSEFTPTGIFVLNNITELNIFCPKTEDNVYAVIGQWGSYKSLGGEEITPIKISLKPNQITKITNWSSLTNGMLYISNQSEKNYLEVLITVKDGIKIPTFNVNETTPQAFNEQLNLGWTPFVELVGKNVFATLQYDLAYDLWSNNLAAINKINQVINMWDCSYEISNHVSGLSLNGSGLTKKYHNMIHITNPDHSTAWNVYAYATNYRITFPYDSGAGFHLFTNPIVDQWGLWHEIGHTYQNLDYMFDGFQEVTVNINAFFIQEEFGFRNRMFERSETIWAIKNYINSTNPNKYIEELDVWGRLGLFLQLHMGYGKEFFPKLNQEYRRLSSLEKPKNNNEKYQTFIKLTSKIVNRNLMPFFKKWGVDIDFETKQIIQKYPLLRTDIWNNIFDNHIEEKTIIDYKL
ncbi:MAG: M60 family metallopeptidase [Spiroplasma sp.]|nr:M60 family metallopeptidase [Spiroplasma sp.]